MRIFKRPRPEPRHLCRLIVVALGAAAGPSGAEEVGLQVLDCRRGSEIGSAVPHERLVWIPSREGLKDARTPVDRSDPKAPDVAVLDFKSPLMSVPAIGCTGLAKIAGIERDGTRLRVILRGADFRWRIDRLERALVVWSPRQIFAELSRAWPSASARRLLVEARDMGVAPEQADDLESRLDFEASRTKGMAATAAGRFAEAAALLQAAFEFVPSDIELGLELARVRYKLEHYDAAEELLESLADIAPQSAEVRHELGLLTLSSQRAQEAREHFRAAAEAGGSAAHFYLGFLAFEAGDDTVAESALGRFLMLEDAGPLAGRARRILEVVAARAAVAEARAGAPPPLLAAGPPKAAQPAPKTPMRSLLTTPMVLRGVNVPDLGVHSLRGQPVILHFWATWCPPCRTEMPLIRRFFRERLAPLGETAPAVVTVSMDYTLEQLDGTLDAWREDETGALPPVYWDPDWHVAMRLELGTALPQTVLVDAEGRVVAGFVGAQDWQGGPLARAIEELIAGGK